jgi:hypothetical protein
LESRRGERIEHYEMQRLCTAELSQANAALQAEILYHQQATARGNVLAMKGFKHDF